jgi:1,4-dihydroxy-6-naphthoate synthase
MNATVLSLGFSPCPNDTYIFHGLMHGLVDNGNLAFNARLEDVETLNRLVLGAALDVSKISYHLLGHVLDRYCLLSSGGALGRGCGPLLIGNRPLAADELRGRPIAVPGRYTTAALLLRLYDPTLENIRYMPFHEIIPAVTRGDVAAGVIIHESRFTYQQHGLSCLVDLGDWWEKDSGHPIPLGGIVARRDLGAVTVSAINKAIRMSIEYARAHPEASRAYIRAHSQEMSDEVCDAHIGLYVNDYSLELGSSGRDAVKVLLERAACVGLIPPVTRDLFVP